MSSCFKEIYTKALCDVETLCLQLSNYTRVCVRESKYVHNLQFVDDIWENWVKRIVKVFSYFCNFSPSLFQNKNVNF